MKIWKKLKKQASKDMLDRNISMKFCIAQFNGSRNNLFNGLQTTDGQRRRLNFSY